MQKEVLERFVALFEGRSDQYAVGGPRKDQPWKFRYSKREAMLTAELVEQHLQGDVTLGVYCEREGEARWVAFDFDPPKDDDDHPVEGGFALALQEAEKARQALLRGGLFTHVERSRSGNGVHLWGFIDSWVDARQLAQAIDSLMPEGLTTWDRAKRYPPLRPSENSVLICLPYAGEAVERGNSMFLRPSGDAYRLEEFLEEVRVNPASVVREIAEKASKAAHQPGRADRPDGSSAAGTGGVAFADFAGRPRVPGTGIVKMLSPFGCGIMRGIWLDQHDQKLVREPEWYAFLGQLTAFKHGREAAHSIFSGHKHYDKAGMDAKYDHALQSPPNGCASLRELVGDKWRCEGCPRTAPYHRGQRPDGAVLPITELVGESPQDLRRALYTKDLERIRRLDASEEPEGVSLGMPGTDPYVRLRPGDFAAFGAQPSIGKSAAMVHIANTLAPQGIDVCMFSAESGEATIHERQIAHRANVDSYALKGMRMHGGEKLRLSREEMARVEEAADWLERQPIWENYSTTTPERIYDAIEAMLCRRGRSFTAPALILYDYFQYAQGSDQFKPGEEHVRFARTSFAFKSITKIIEQPFMTFAQLIRDSEGDADPQINWWRGTARLEHDIDIGLIMTGERMPGLFAPRALHCVKQREGQVGWKLDMLLEQQVSRFKGSSQETESRDILSDAPWRDAGGQFSMAPPAED